MKNKYVTEEQKEVKKFLILILGLVIIIIGIYFFTRAFVTKDLNKSKDSDSYSYTAGSINDNVAIVGTMLSRPEKEYYIVAFSNEDFNLSYYNTIISKYSEQENALKVYYLDLDNALNKNYVATNDEDFSTKFTDLENLKFGEFTLLKIKNGKVTKFITNVDKAKAELINKK